MRHRPCVVMHVWTLGGLRQQDCHELKASLGYMVISRMASAICEDLVSKK